jgi:hypothetical protein
MYILLNFRIGILDPTITRNESSLLWQEVDPKNSGYVDLSVLHSYLSDRYGRDKSSAKPSSVLERVINRIKERGGGGGIKGLQRYFHLFFINSRQLFTLILICSTIQIMDDDGNKTLSKEELR